MKKVLSCGLVLALLITATPVVTTNTFAATKKTQVTFTDKDAKNWIKSYVKLVFSKSSNINKNSKNYRKASNPALNFMNNLPVR